MAENDNLDNKNSSGPGIGYDSIEVKYQEKGLTKFEPSNRNIITYEEARKVIESDAFVRAFEYFQGKHHVAEELRKYREEGNEHLNQMETDHTMVYYTLLTIKAQGEGRYFIIGKDGTPNIPKNNSLSYDESNKAFIFSRGDFGEENKAYPSDIKNLKRDQIKGMFDEMLYINPDEDEKDRNALASHITPLYKLLELNRKSQISTIAISNEGKFALTSRKKTGESDELPEGQSTEGKRFGGFDHVFLKFSFKESAIEETKNLISQRKASKIYLLNEKRFDDTIEGFNNIIMNLHEHNEEHGSSMKEEEMELNRYKATICSYAMEFMYLVRNHSKHDCVLVAKGYSEDMLHQTGEFEPERKYKGDMSELGLDRLLAFKSEYEDGHNIFPSKNYNLKYLAEKLEEIEKLIPDAKDLVETARNIFGIKCKEKVNER